MASTTPALLSYSFLADILWEVPESNTGRDELLGSSNPGL